MFGTIDGRNIVAFFSCARDFLPVFRGFGEQHRLISTLWNQAGQEKYFLQIFVVQRRRKRK
jgi:hypothetical protein